MLDWVVKSALELELGHCTKRCGLSDLSTVGDCMPVSLSAKERAEEALSLFPDF
jgi:hypothetical protein